MSMKYPEKAKLQRQKADRWPPGAGVGREGAFKWARGVFLGDGTVMKSDSGAGCTALRFAKDY